jgi:TolB-like protein
MGNLARFNPVTFYGELRRRRVVHVAFIYAAVAGGVISACDWIFPQVPALAASPEQALRWVIIAVVGCFPIVLIVGWLYDITVEGLQRTPSYSDLAHDTDPSLHRVDRWIIGGLSAVMLGVMVLAVVKVVQIEPPATVDAATPTVLDPMALAVLPLVDRSANGEDAGLLAFGLHDTLLSRLSQIQTLRVISRTTMERYKGTTKTLPEIARELGVANLIEGSVQRAGNQVRISVQLVRAPHDEHLWAEVYDQELTATNLFQVQTEIARAVATELAARLSPEEGQALEFVPTTNTEAYTAYMLGRQRLRQHKTAELAGAVEQFSRAITLDPGYAAAHAGLFDACDLHTSYSTGHLLLRDHSGGDLHPLCPKNRQEALALARRAVALDEQCGEAWISLAMALWYQWQESEFEEDRLRDEINRAFQRGLALSPSFSRGYHRYALLLGVKGAGLGGTDRDLGVNIALKGLGVDPLSVPLHYQVSRFYEQRGQFDEAFRYARRLIEIAPDSPKGHERLAELEGGVRGRLDQLILGEVRAARLDPQHVQYPEEAGWAYMNLGDYDMALRYYERAASLLDASNPYRHRLNLKRAVAILHQGDRERAVSLLQQVLKEADRESYGTRIAAVLLAHLSMGHGRAKDALGYLKTGWPDCFDGDPISVGCEEHIGLKFVAVPILQALGQGEKVRQWEPDLRMLLEERDFADMGTAAWRLGWDAPGNINDVATLALYGHREQALATLERAVDQGYRGNRGMWWPGGWKYAQQFDASFSSIRGDPRFQAAFARIEADMNEQLEIVREMERRGGIPARDQFPKPSLGP